MRWNKTNSHWQDASLEGGKPLFLSWHIIFGYNDGWSVHNWWPTIMCWYVLLLLFAFICQNMSQIVQFVMIYSIKIVQCFNSPAICFRLHSHDWKPEAHLVNWRRRVGHILRWLCSMEAGAATGHCLATLSTAFNSWDAASRQAAGLGSGNASSRPSWDHMCFTSWRSNPFYGHPNGLPAWYYLDMPWS